MKFLSTQETGEKWGCQNGVSPYCVHRDVSRMSKRPETPG